MWRAMQKLLPDGSYGYVVKHEGKVLSSGTDCVDYEYLYFPKFADARLIADILNRCDVK